MGRIRQMIEVGGRTLWTVFKAGARNTYTVPAVAQLAILGIAAAGLYCDPPSPAV
jgi:hypothetical protein